MGEELVEELFDPGMISRLQAHLPEKIEQVGGEKRSVVTGDFLGSLPIRQEVEQRPHRVVPKHGLVCLGHSRTPGARVP